MVETAWDEDEGLVSYRKKTFVCSITFFCWPNLTDLSFMSLARHGSFEDEIKKVEELEMVEGFELALKEWSGWLELNQNPNAKLFFVSLSPTHVWSVLPFRFVTALSS